MRIASIVLAAGNSSRMGPCNKLLESIGGEPMVRRVAAIALGSGCRADRRRDRLRGRFGRRGTSGAWRDR